MPGDAKDAAVKRAAKGRYKLFSMTDPTDESAPRWRADIDSLAFRPDGHGGGCVVHRHAFRTLLGRMPTPQDCAAFYGDHFAAFQAAAAAKLGRTAAVPDAHFHLTSRDLARALAE